MTLNDFCNDLTAASRVWYLRNVPFDSGRRIRSIKGGDCPIVAVANEKNGVTMFSTGDPRRAADAIDLPTELATLIMDSADGFPRGRDRPVDPVIRQRLLEACNLIVPEITERRKTNEKLQVS